MHQDVEMIYKEHLDIMDKETRQTLLALDEQDEGQIMQSLCGKLYEKIVDKVDDIDFGQIPRTKGDITKLSNYDDLLESISIIKGLLTQFRQPTKPIDIVSDALTNVQKRVDLFEKGFRYDVEFVMMTYSTIALSIVSAVSFLISTCVEYIKLPTKDEFQITLDHVALAKSKDNLLLVNLEKFNKACSKGDLDKGLTFVMATVSGEKGLLGLETSVVIGSVALVILITSIVPLLRELIFFFYYTRTKVSDYFEIQGNLLQMNAYRVQSNSEIDKTKRDKIVSKQLRIADTFKNIADKVGISVKKSEIQATKEIQSDNTKYKSSDLLETMPDSVGSKIF